MVISVTVNLNHTVRKQSAPSSLAHNTRMQRSQISEEIDQPIMHKHLTSIRELCSSPTTASLAPRICFRRVTTSASNSSSATASMHISSRQIITQICNVTGRQRGSRRKLQAGYRTPSLQRTSYLCVTLLCCAHYIIHRQVYSTFGHHPHPLGYLCAKFRFCRGPRCWASTRRKISYSINQSITQLIWCPSLSSAL